MQIPGLNEYARHSAVLYRRQNAAQVSGDVASSAPNFACRFASSDPASSCPGAAGMKSGHCALASCAAAHHATMARARYARMAECGLLEAAISPSSPRHAGSLPAPVGCVAWLRAARVLGAGRDDSRSLWPMVLTMRVAGFAENQTYLRNGAASGLAGSAKHPDFLCAGPRGGSAAPTMIAPAPWRRTRCACC